VDPVGGAYAIEEMTTRIEQQASELLERIQSLGGTLSAIESGYVQRQIQDSAYAAQQALDSGAAVMVGVNRYVDTAPRTRRVFQIDPDIERQQVERVRTLRATRNDAEWRAALAAVDRAARGGDNLVPPIIAAVEKRVTLGEVAGTLRQVFGEYQETSP
jgi:methylmalonyl-CoA mutase N-terminal domain/subunit